MVGTADVQPTIGVKDLATATRFYGGVLGLQLVSENPFEVIYKSGNCRMSIYVTSSAGTNQATYATWEVDDIDAEVDDLKGKGVQFEQYDMEGVTRDGDIHTLGDSGEKAAWFKDPDGNILCLHAAA
jgi:catechol 2,3-dioxygenase-like lactoylglutathione lyase family enzyme